MLCSLGAHVTGIDCVPGAGKTQMAVALALWVRWAPEKALLLFAEPNHAMAEQVYSRLVLLRGSDEGLCRLGFDAVNSLDHVEQVFWTRTTSAMLAEVAFLDAVDGAVRCLASLLDQIGRAHV